ncbi:hypothetical protein BDA96_04G226300 [Sorghum bicolor]|uniref:Uncharacterized protein n=2 Tax=Sorghum bicolor TaxID=4558 RepID=A0A921R6W0_SORBI|nr:hypothetical protein BDA96_04G226300 [Sorghum bicolor]OQU85295.1 hypothetical protein SORBI_3004G212250 [Sorghum bicolor]
MGVRRLDLARRRGVLCWCWDPPGWTASTQTGRPGAGDLPRSDEVRAASAVTEECTLVCGPGTHAALHALTHTWKADRARAASRLSARPGLCMQ